MEASWEPHSRSGLGWNEVRVVSLYSHNKQDSYDSQNYMLYLSPDYMKKTRALIRSNIRESK